MRSGKKNKQFPAPKVFFCLPFSTVCRIPTVAMKEPSARYFNPFTSIFSNITLLQKIPTPHPLLKVTTSSMFNIRYYGDWSPTDLPIMPRVAYAHKILKTALNNCKEHLPSHFVRNLTVSLLKVRSHNWNLYNCNGLNSQLAEQAKEALRELCAFKNKLPPLLQEAIGNIQVFESLESAISCLDKRVAAQTLNGINSPV